MSEKTPANLTILLVEDDEDTRFLMRLELERRGYRLIEAEDGEKAVALAQQERPDIILMDISLPRMDGLEATKQIRNHDRKHTILKSIETQGKSQPPIKAATTDYQNRCAPSGRQGIMPKC